MLWILKIYFGNFSIIGGQLTKNSKLTTKTWHLSISRPFLDASCPLTENWDGKEAISASAWPKLHFCSPCPFLAHFSSNFHKKTWNKLEELEVRFDFLHLQPLMAVCMVLKWPFSGCIWLNSVQKFSGKMEDSSLLFELKLLRDLV